MTAETAIRTAAGRAGGTDRFEARLLAEAQALGVAAARLRPIGRRPRDGALGAHGRRRAGPGSAFWQYRPYIAGESARSIDWRRSAKGDQPIVREREWEAALTLDLWIDASASMSYPRFDAPDGKRRRADLLGLAAAAAWLKNGERIRVLGDPRGRGAAKLSSVAGALARTAHAAPDDQEAGLPPRQAAPRHGFVLLIGDFLAEPGLIVERAAKLARSGARGFAIQVLHADEAGLGFRGRVEFASIENADTHLLRHVESGRAPYLERLEAHHKALSDGLARVGWPLIMHQTAEAPAPALTMALSALAVGR